MTDTPMTPAREQEIRTLDLLALMSDRAAPVISGHLAVLLAEVDRLRKALSDVSGQVSDLDWLHARVAILERIPVDEAAELAEGRAQLDAMRADHPAPCRVPDSPDCTCPPGEEPPVVAYRLYGHGDIRCPRCIPAPRSDLWTPVTSEELPEGGVCYQCGRDVLIPALTEESTP